jgi:thiamine pyrophosphokinase
MLRFRLTSHVLISLFQIYDILVLGGLSGRLDQTVYTLSYLHKLRKSRRRVFVVTDDNVGWVLDKVGKLFSHTNSDNYLGRRWRESILSMSTTPF